MTKNLPQTSTNTSLSRVTSSLPLSRTRRLERSTERRVQAVVADGFVEANKIAIDTENSLARVDGRTAIGEARVHGAAVIQHAETMGVGDIGDAADARLARSGPVAQQLIGESLAHATRRVGGVTDRAINDL